jgi:hypothetical protein
LVGVPELYVRSASEKSHEEIESVVGEISKETALLLAGAELEEPEKVIVVQPYDENVGEWAKAIALWMQKQKPERVGFIPHSAGSLVEEIIFLTSGPKKRQNQTLPIVETNQVLETTEPNQMHALKALQHPT